MKSSHPVVNALQRISACLVTGAMIVAGVAVAVIVVINTLDTIGMAFFNKPLVGTLEITEVLLAMAILLAIPSALRERKHISIDVITQFFGPKMLKAAEVFTLLLTVLVFAILTVQSYDSAMTSIATFETSAGYIRVPIWLGKIAVAVGFAFALLEVVIQFFIALTTGQVFQKEDEVTGADA